MPINADTTGSLRTRKKYIQETHQCTKCGVTVAGGWGHFNHKKVCNNELIETSSHSTPTSSKLTLPVRQDAIMSRLDAGVHDPMLNSFTLSTEAENEHFEPDDSYSNNGLAAELTEYIASLPDLDAEHVTECLHWGRTIKTDISDTTRQVARFLKVSMLGQGLSGEHMQAFLDYTHEMGGEKAPLLPNKVEGCWKEIAKVPLFVQCTYECWNLDDP